MQAEYWLTTAPFVVLCTIHLISVTQTGVRTNLRSHKRQDWFWKFMRSSFSLKRQSIILICRSGDWCSALWSHAATSKRYAFIMRRREVKQKQNNLIWFNTWAGRWGLRLRDSWSRWMAGVGMTGRGRRRMLSEPPALRWKVTSVFSCFYTSVSWSTTQS